MEQTMIYDILLTGFWSFPLAIGAMFAGIATGNKNVEHFGGFWFIGALACLFLIVWCYVLEAIWRTQ